MKPLPRNGQAVITIKDGVVVDWKEAPPHGRLVDSEALKDALAVLLERNNNLIDEWLAYAIEDVIDDQPTIIEAEGRETE